MVSKRKIIFKKVFKKQKLNRFTTNRRRVSLDRNILFEAVTTALHIVLVTSALKIEKKFLNVKRGFSIKHLFTRVYLLVHTTHFLQSKDP